jgi:hypothetical protein
VPTQLGERPAWFRVIYCAGKIYPCWWHIQTHLYAPVTRDEESTYALHPLSEITQKIALLSELDLFSTEIALMPDGKFVVVDYVNDQIDLRLQSKTPDGVPDQIVQALVEELVAFTAKPRFTPPKRTMMSFRA